MKIFCTILVSPSPRVTGAMMPDGVIYRGIGNSRIIEYESLIMAIE
jgi:hypothetical protein